MNMDSGSSSLSTYVVTGLAILGIALGGAGLYVGLSGRSAEQQREGRLSEVEQKVDRLGGASEELNNSIRGLYSSTRQSLDGLAEQLTALREELKPRIPAPTPAAAATAAQVGASSPSGKTYAIRAGDLLGKVAKDHGTTVDAILKVNPGLNPSRLKIGQVINLP